MPSRSRQCPEWRANRSVDISRRIKQTVDFDFAVLAVVGCARGEMEVASRVRSAKATRSEYSAVRPTAPPDRLTFWLTELLEYRLHAALTGSANRVQESGGTPDSWSASWLLPPDSWAGGAKKSEKE